MSNFASDCAKFQRSIENLRRDEELRKCRNGDGSNDQFRECFYGKEYDKLILEIAEMLKHLESAAAKLQKYPEMKQLEEEYMHLIWLKSVIASKEYHMVQLLKTVGVKADDLSRKAFGCTPDAVHQDYAKLKSQMTALAKDKRAFEAAVGLKQHIPKKATGQSKKRIEKLSVGETVTMGNYGGEPIEWLVLATEGDKCTMIAVKGQDAARFNKSKSDGNKWENSDIRTWLNDTYYNTAFSTEERAMITTGPTGDKVWLLSVDEAKKYFANDRARVCYATNHAKKNGAWTVINGAARWWLRSPGSNSSLAAYVGNNGSVQACGYGVVKGDELARPVVVVSSDLFAERLKVSETVSGTAKINAPAVDKSKPQVKKPQGSTVVDASKFVVGKTVTMGYYGGTRVKWLVLAAKGNRRTMIAVKGQDAVRFNKSCKGGNQWENSYIRTWLNKTYYNTAFSAKEQAMITTGPTGDKVWLLSVEEAEEYFAKANAIKCYPTAYAKKNGAWTNNDGAGWWWLRSPSCYSRYAARVDCSGGVDYDGGYVIYDFGMARPVVVVSLGF